MSILLRALAGRIVISRDRDMRIVLSWVGPGDIRSIHGHPVFHRWWRAKPGAESVDRQDTANMWKLVVIEGAWGFHAALVAGATVLTVLLRGYGAGPKMIGSIASIEGGLIVLPQVLGIYVFKSRRQWKKHMVAWHLVCIVPFLFLNGFIIAFAGEDVSAFARWGLLLSFACMMAGIGTVIAVWMEWMASLFGTRIRGTVLGIAWFISALCGAAAGFLSGRLIDHFPGKPTYAVLYLAAGIAATISCLMIMTVRDKNAGEMPNRVGFGTRFLISRFRQSLVSANFRSFLIGRILATFGFCIVPFLAVHFLSDAGGSLSKGTVVSCGAAMTVGMAVANLVLGRLGDLRGHRIGILVSAAMQVVALTIVLLSSGIWSCISVYLCVGVCMSGGFLSHTNMLFETCPHDHRLAHITVGNLVLSVPMLGAPLLAGAVVGGWSTTTLFAVCLVISVIALLWLAAFVKEPRHLDLGATIGSGE
jgi:MFS family permease